MINKKISKNIYFNHKLIREPNITYNSTFFLFIRVSSIFYYSLKVILTYFFGPYVKIAGLYNSLVLQILILSSWFSKAVMISFGMLIYRNFIDE